MAIKFLNSVAVDTDVLFVDTANERVGIGTETPSSILELAGATPILTLSSTAVNVAQGIEWRNSGTLDAYIKQGPSTAEFEFNVGRNTTWGGDFKFVTDTYDAYRITKNDHRFFIVGSEKMRIASSGNVGIGTTSPGYKLTVAGDAGFSDWIYASKFYPTSSTTDILMQTGAGRTITLDPTSTGKVLIPNGNVGIGTTSPTQAKLVVSGNVAFNQGDETMGQINPEFERLDFKVSDGVVDATPVAMTLREYAGGARLGIGTTSPGYKLSVSGNIGLTDGVSTGLLALVGGNYYIQNTGAYSTVFQTNGAERMRITSTGNVGIGTTSPDSFNSEARNLVVNGSGDVGISIATTTTTGNSSVVFADGTGGTAGYRGRLKYGHATDYMAFFTAAAERLRIESTGNVGIGTTSPNTKLDVISGTNGGIRISATDTTSNWRDIDIRSYVSQAQANALPDGSAIYTTNPTSQTETAFSKYGGTVIQGRDDGNSSFAIRLGNGGGYATRMFMGATGETTFSNTVQASGYKSSDGTAGITGTMSFVDKDSVTRTITYKNGLVVGVTP